MVDRSIYKTSLCFIKADKLSETTKNWLDEEEELMQIRNSDAAAKAAFFNRMVAQKQGSASNPKSGIWYCEFGFKIGILDLLFMVISKNLRNQGR